MDCVLIYQEKQWEHEDNSSNVRAKWSSGYPLIVTRVEPLLPTSNHPRNKFAQNIENIELIFKLLKNDSVHYTQACWGLLTYIPNNSRIKKNIADLNLVDGWDSLLDSHSIYRLLYALQIVVKIIRKDKQKKRHNWNEMFVNRNGGEHLFHCLLNVPIELPLAKKCFALLLEIITEAFSEEQLDKIELYQKKKDEIIYKILSAIEEFMKPEVQHRQSLLSQEEESMLIDSLERNAREADSNKDANAVKGGFAVIKKTFKEDYNYFERIAKYPNFIELIRNGIFLSDNKALQESFLSELHDICKDYKKFLNSSFAPHKIIPNILVNELLDKVANSKRDCEKFYELLCKTIKLFPKDLLLQSSIDHLSAIKRYAQILISHKSTEHNTKVDTTLAKILELLKVSLKKFPEYKLIIGQDNLLNEVLHKCLLDYPKSGNRRVYRSGSPLPPKCKSKSCRRLGYDLLRVLIEGCEENLNVVLEYLPALHLKESQRVNCLDKWEISSPINEKSDTGYMGIKNLSCICYMISLLQQLYMIPSFRNAIVSARRIIPRSKAEELPSDPMLVQLQHLFTSLHEGVKQYCNPKKFCLEFKDWEGNPINSAEQMDVDEFFNTLMDKLESALRETNEANLIKEHFGGIYLNQIIGKDCGHKREIEEPFLAINLQIKNKTSLEDSIKSFVEGEVMEGNNAYQCDECKTKVAAVKCVCIKSLPDHLIFVLKRFSYDYDTMQKVKLNDYCEFPMKINMNPYMSEQSTDINNEYKLVGIVIHRGVADSGHYYSFIQERENDNEWFEFNDIMVLPFDINKRKEEVFGGENQWDDGIRRQRTERSSNAYMLFYERIIPTKVDHSSFNAYPEILKLVQQKNVKYWQNKFFLSEDYFNFVNSLGQIWTSTKPSSWRPSPDSLLKVFKYLVTVMTTVFIRGKTKKYMCTLYDTIITRLKQCPLAAEWLIWEFTNKRVTDEYLLGIGPSESHLIIIGLITEALETLCREEKDKVENGNACIVVNFLNFLIATLSEDKCYKSLFYLRLLSKVAMIGPEVRQYLKRVNTIERILSFLKNKELPSEKLYVPFVLNSTSCLAAPECYEIQKIESSTGLYDLSFMVHCLFTLLRSCKLSEEESPLALKPTSQIANSSIIFDLVRDDSIKRIFHDCGYKVGYNSYFKAIAHVAWETLEVKTELRKALIKILNESEHDVTDLCIRPMVIMINYEDRYAIRFIKGMLADINEIAEKHRTSYYFVYGVATSLMRVCKKSRLIRNEMRNMGREFSWMKNYFNELPCPPVPKVGWTIKLYKNQECNDKALEKVCPYYQQQTDIDFRQRTSLLLEKFNKYIESHAHFIDEEEVINSNDDMYEENLKKGDVVEYSIRYDSRSCKWVQAEVEECTGAHLHLSYKVDGKECRSYVDPASDLLAKKGTHDITDDLEQSSTSKENALNDSDSH